MVEGPYYYIGRARGKDVFLTKHAFENIGRYGIRLSNILKALNDPLEVYREKIKAKLRGFERYVYVKQVNGKYLVVVVEEDGLIIVVTTFRIHDRKRYEKHKVNKVRRKEWIPHA